MSTRNHIATVYKIFSNYLVLNNAKFNGPHLINSTWTLNDVVSSNSKPISITYTINENCEVFTESAPLVQDSELIFDIYSNCGLHRVNCFERKFNDVKENVLHFWHRNEFVKCINLKDLNVHGLIYKRDFNMGGLQWLNGGRKIVYVADKKKEKRVSHFQTVPNKSGNTEDNTAIGSQYLFNDIFGEQMGHIESPILCVLDVSDERVELLEILPEGFIAGKICIHPSKESFVIKAYKKFPYKLGLIYCMQRSSELFYYDLNSKDIKRIGSEDKSKFSPRFSPDGEYLIWLENDANGPHMQCQRLMRYSCSTKLTVTVVDIVKDPIEGFTGIYNLGLTDNCWHSDNRHVFISSLCRGENKIFVVEIESSSIKKLELEDSNDGAILLDVNHLSLLIKVSSPSTVPYIALADIEDALKSGKLRLKPISRVHSIDNVEWKFLEHTPSFVHPKYGRNEFQSLLISPKDHSNSPLILALHGGPHSAFSNEFYLFFAAAAELGFSSLLVNYRGSWGYGQVSIDSLLGFIGEMDVSDCIVFAKFKIIESKMFEKNSEGINDFMYGTNVAQCHVSVRLGFLRKVYGILSTQLALTTVIGAIMLYFQAALKIFLHENVWIVFLCLVVNIGLLLALFIYRQRTPHNFIMLFLFTFVESITVGFIIIHYNVMAVLVALILTLIVSISLTIYTFQTKRDFSTWGAGLFAGLIILTIGGFLQIFVGSSRLELLLAIGGAFLFSMLIIYDTWMSMHRLSPEEYVMACIDLYLDIINLFIHILRIIGSAKDN